MMQETKTMISTANQKEVDEMMNFIKTLNAEEQKEFLAFITGVKFARRKSQEDARQQSA